MPTPAELLEEILRFREVPPSKTAEFSRWTHDQLCELSRIKLEELGESFLKYHHITYVVQGPRDQGVDVLLKASQSDDEPESLVGIQIKSFVELDDKANDLSKQLKAGYHDARNHYGPSLKRYYIALCGDANKHHKRISAISTEFAKETAVRIIGPRYLFTFMTLPRPTLEAVVDRFLSQDDYVRREARLEVRGYSDAEIYFLLRCLSYAYESGNNLLPIEYFEHDFYIQEFCEQFGDDAFDATLYKFQDCVLESSINSNSTLVRLENYQAVRALYYDIKVRYGESKEDLFHHMYEFLKI